MTTQIMLPESAIIVGRRQNVFDSLLRFVFFQDHARLALLADFLFFFGLARFA